MSQLSAPSVCRPRLPRTSQEQVSNKRGREDSTDVVPPMRESNQKKKKTDFRGFCDFDTDYLRSDDDEDFDDVESESEYERTEPVELVPRYYGEEHYDEFKEEMDEDAKNWLKYCVAHSLGDLSREPDWSFQPSEFDPWPSLKRPAIEDDNTNEDWVELENMSETIYQKFPTIANYIHGYRIVKDFNHGAIYLGIKPKVHYSALRHVFEHTLHRWGLSNNIGKDYFASTGSIGLDVHADGNMISFVAASFTPLLARTNTQKMKSSKLGFPTMVFNVAHRHLPFDELEGQVMREFLSMKNSIQAFIGIKIYDDKKFRVLVVTRNYDTGKVGNPRVDLRSSLLPTDEVTDLEITIPGKSLLWDCDDWIEKDVPDFVLDVESLRFMFRK